MKKIITKKEFLANRKFYLEEIIKGKIFIYPTDTIYGIGCSANNSSSILKIREIKKREEKPFSIISPSKSWILKNLKVNLNNIKFLKKLPGPYTLIFELKNQDSIAKDELIGNKNTIGVRIPKNWFSSIISKSQIPFVTTSVNVSGEKHITKVDEISKDIEDKVDYIIDCGLIDNNPSTIYDLTNKKVDSLKRNK